MFAFAAALLGQDIEITAVGTFGICVALFGAPDLMAEAGFGTADPAYEVRAGCAYDVVLLSGIYGISPLCFEYSERDGQGQ